VAMDTWAPRCLGIPMGAPAPPVDLLAERITPWMYGLRQVRCAIPEALHTCTRPTRDCASETIPAAVSSR